MQMMFLSILLAATSMTSIIAHANGIKSVRIHREGNESQFVLIQKTGQEYVFSDCRLVGSAQNCTVIHSLTEQVLNNRLEALRQTLPSMSKRVSNMTKDTLLVGAGVYLSMGLVLFLKYASDGSLEKLAPAMTSWEGICIGVVPAVLTAIHRMSTHAGRLICAKSIDEAMNAIAQMRMDDGDGLTFAIQIGRIEHWGFRRYLREFLLNFPAFLRQHQTPGANSL